VERAVAAPTANIRVVVPEAGTAAGGAWLDAYEKSLTNLLAFENQAAGASQSDWISALAKAHTDFIANITTAYTKAARGLLK
jgi:hypothetical protein